VTVDPSKLQSIFDLLEKGKPLTPTDVEVLVAGLASKQVTMANAKGAIAIGESADEATIISGDRNISISKELAQVLQEKGASIDLHSGDRTVVNNYFFNVSADAAEKNNRLSQQFDLLLAGVNPEIVQQARQKSLPVDASLWGVREEELIFNSQQLSKFVGELIGNEQILTMPRIIDNNGRLRFLCRNFLEPL
jgi:hypothetical protein